MVQVAPESVAVLPVPDESAEVVPDPSSSFQCPSSPLSIAAPVGIPQAMLQPPQLFGSVVVSTQVPLQSVPDVQVQAPATQVSPPAVLQACPQLPQLLTSVAVAVQLPLQAVWPPEQAAQLLALQVSRPP